MRPNCALLSCTVALPRASSLERSQQQQERSSFGYAAYARPPASGPIVDIEHRHRARLLLLVGPGRYGQGCVNVSSPHLDCPDGNAVCGPTLALSDRSSTVVRRAGRFHPPRRHGIAALRFGFAYIPLRRAHHALQSLHPRAGDAAWIPFLRPQRSLSATSCGLLQDAWAVIAAPDMFTRRK
ncbi:hypothetical protein K491DRAFT_288708 [Lophiostoma macrostomum CBS 122681]|uniref:Uncharacterized protein n=1 Tax=Lophiostoma macrostomum CBS 122681 TaxID=1314788 RepID=A0A6A6TGW7_9PLEO|nr:hypothetical protein K491DRAFT_288708 [Lophiostoma macrostomum CBS 122681]